MTPTDNGRRDGLTCVSLHAGPDTHVFCHTYPDTAPILAIFSPGVDWSLTCHHRQVSPDDLAFARRLHAATQTFLADCQRLCPPDIPTTTAPSSLTSAAPAS